jgi:hypothetical protein
MNRIWIRDLTSPTMIAVFSVLLGFPAVFAERECVIASLDDTMPVTHSFECSRLYHSVVALAAASLSEHRTTCNAFAATACAQLDTCRLINTCNDTSCTFDESLIRLAANPRCPALPRRASMASLAVCAPTRLGYGDLCVGQPTDACVDVTFDSRTAHSTVVPPGSRSSSAFGRTVSRGPLRNVLQWRGPAYVFPERNVDAAPQRWSAWLADINVVVDEQRDAAVGVAFAVNQSITQQHYAAVWRGDVVELLSIDNDVVRVVALSNSTGVPLLRTGVWANLQVRLANDQVSVSVNADAMSNDSRRTVALTARLPTVPPRGFVGLFLSNGSGFSDDFTVRRLPVVGACGDGVCDARADEDCINCATDCVAPCGCGDGVCWGDDEVVDGCFDCRPVVVSNRDASRHWAPRADNVAAFFSFDNATVLGADVSGNGLDLNSTAVASSTTESCARGSCAKLNGADQGLALAVVSSAYGRLPVGLSPITIMLFVRFDPPLAESRRKSAPLLQFGSADDGTQSLVTLWRNDTHGRLRWLHGSLVLDIEVDWAAPGARHMAFSYSNGALLIRVDNQVFNAASCAHNGIVPVMTTFGRLTIGGGGFVGTVDELVILAENASDAMFQRHGTDANWTVARAPVRQTSDGDVPAPAPQAPRVFEDCNNFRACNECALKNDCVWCDVSGCVPVGVICSGSVFLTCGETATELPTTNGTSSHPNVTRVSDERDQYNLITSVAVLVGTALSLYVATASLLLFLHFRHKRMGANIKYDKLSAATGSAEGGGDIDDDTVTNLN